MEYFFIWTNSNYLFITIWYASVSSSIQQYFLGDFERIFPLTFNSGVPVHKYYLETITSFHLGQNII